CRTIRAHGMMDRVIVASFRSEVLDEFRRECAEVATSASAADVRTFLALKAVRLEDNYDTSARALQVPEYAGGWRVLTADFVAAAHRRGVEVHAWTINDEDAMRRMFELGVDGVITDYPDRMIALLHGRP
ncbi:MAG: glycerophosphodiester phosphodiesterase family protein, partial [Pyrinomonadaceae bacterium]